MAIENWTELEQLGARELEARSGEKLKQLIRHAYNNVPYYRDLMTKYGISPLQIQDRSDLATFPVLDKPQIREGLKKGVLLARNIPRWRRVATQTTGSTGIPLFFYSDALSDQPRSVAWRLLDSWAGVRPGDERVWLTVPRPKPAWDHWHPIASWRKRRRFRQPPDMVSVYLLKTEDLPRVISAIDRSVPYFVYGIGSSIRFIAEHSPVMGCRLDYQPRVVIGTSDTFLAKHRKRVSRFFGCPVLSRYGSYEVGGGVAQTCSENPEVHHVLSELVIIEVVDQDNQPVKPGQHGKLLLTDLTNYVMPIVRYDIGDIAVAAQSCHCERRWPVIGEIFGRTADRLMTFTGEWLDAWQLEIVLFYQNDFNEAISEYQFIQHRRGEVEMLLVANKRVNGRVLDRLRNALHQALGDRINFEISLVPNIAPEPQGKRRLAISELYRQAH